jgi:hypothetical protein
LAVCLRCTVVDDRFDGGVDGGPTGGYNGGWWMMVVMEVHTDGSVENLWLPKYRHCFLMQLYSRTYKKAEPKANQHTQQHCQACGAATHPTPLWVSGSTAKLIPRPGPP